MAKADLSFGKGAKVHIEGTPEEVANLLARLQPQSQKGRAASHKRRASNSKAKHSGKKRKAPSGPQTVIDNLIGDTFFSSQKTIADILAKLAEKGHIHEPNEVSTPLLRLVKKGRLARKKVDGVWMYQEPMP